MTAKWFHGQKIHRDISFLNKRRNKFIPFPERISFAAQLTSQTFYLKPGFLELVEHFHFLLGMSEQVGFFGYTGVVARG